MAYLHGDKLNVYILCLEMPEDALDLMVLDPLELEFQVGMRCDVAAGKQKARNDIQSPVPRF